MRILFAKGKQMPCGWEMVRTAGPIWAAAIHAGHRVRAELAERLAIDESMRLREEDPFTDQWTELAPNRITVSVSRFEVDLNRPREQAVYLKPEDAWGLPLWRVAPFEEMIRTSRQKHDAFYAALGRTLDDLSRGVE